MIRAVYSGYIHYMYCVSCGRGVCVFTTATNERGERKSATLGIFTPALLGVPPLPSSPSPSLYLALTLAIHKSVTPPTVGVSGGGGRLKDAVVLRNEVGFLHHHPDTPRILEPSGRGHRTPHKMSCTCVYAHVCIRVCVHTLYVCVRKCVCVCASVCVCVHVQYNVHVSVCFWVCTCACGL